MSYERGYNRKGRSDRRRDGGKHKPVVGEKGREVLESIDSNSLVIKSFQQYATELDCKHDKYERIVKLSRDITIESKRIIFLLHTLDRESKMVSVLSEAELRFSQLSVTHFQSIARELEGEDPYQFLRAYTAGLQEYIEAVTFYHYLKNNSLQNWNEIQKELSYILAGPKKGLPEENKVNDTITRQLTDDQKASEMEEKELTKTSEEEDSPRPAETLVPPTDYILGVADLTGELMRKCINNLGSGNVESCYQTCAFVKEIYNGFLGIGNTGTKELGRKLYTLRQSLTKMENVCYTIHVRGSEIPKHMLAEVLSATQDEFLDADEGFY